MWKYTYGPKQDIQFYPAPKLQYLLVNVLGVKECKKLNPLGYFGGFQQICTRSGINQSSGKVIKCLTHKIFVWVITI